MSSYNKNSKNILHHAKHFLIPHEHNDYKPYFFREASVSILLATTLFLFGLSATSAYIIQATEIGKEIISKVLIDITNKNRLENSLPILNENKKLYSAASLKAKDMLENQYFAHESPSGLKPWDFLALVNYDYSYTGENLAINHSDNNQTGDAWMNSPLHRKNILDPNFKEIGVSAYSGNYEGRETIFVVQMFGARSKENENTLIKEVAGLIPEVTDKNKKIPSSKITATTKTKEIVMAEKLNKNISVIVVDKNPETKESFIKSNLREDNAEQVKVLGEQKINYSTVLDRLIYSGSNYVQNILQILFITILIAALLMIFIEVKKQHMRHVAYAALLLIILITLMYLNKNYLELNFMFLK